MIRRGRGRGRPVIPIDGTRAPGASPRSPFVARLTPSFEGVRDPFFRALQYKKVLLVTTPPGLGKSTCIPPLCLEYLESIGCKSHVICTEPRVIAAEALARRFKETYGRYGQDLVGSRVRFRKISSPETRLWYVTEGMLLRECAGIVDTSMDFWTLDSTPIDYFQKYGIVILDEVHERSTDVDILLGLCKIALDKRNDAFRVVIMSATADVEKIKRYFGEENIGTFQIGDPSQASLFPVEIEYDKFEYVKGSRSADDNEDGLPSDQKFRQLAHHIASVVSRVIDHRDGHVLIFVAGRQDVHWTMEYLAKDSRTGSIPTYPLLGDLTQEEQMFAMYGKGESKRIIVATNIAESSITIPNIGIVVDSGYFKCKVFHYFKEIDRLDRRLISKSSAMQRTGRTGRTCPGLCIRLYGEHEFLESFKEMAEPEILRISLEEVALELKLLRQNIPAIAAGAKAAFEIQTAKKVPGDKADTLVRVEGDQRAAVDIEMDKGSDAAARTAQISGEAQNTADALVRVEGDQRAAVDIEMGEGSYAAAHAAQLSGEAQNNIDANAFMDIAPPPTLMNFPSNSFDSSFPFIDQPTNSQLGYAGSVLFAFDAIDQDGRLTELGFRMACTPLPPHLSKSLFEADNLSIVDPLLKVCAMSSLMPILALPFDKEDRKTALEEWRNELKGQFQSDHLLYLHIFEEISKAKQNGSDVGDLCKRFLIKESTMTAAMNVYQQLKWSAAIGLKREILDDSHQRCDQFGEKLIYVITKGLFMRVAHLSGRGYVLPRERFSAQLIPCKVSATSIVDAWSLPKDVIFESSLNGVLSCISPINFEWLPKCSIERINISKWNEEVPKKTRKIILHPIRGGFPAGFKERHIYDKLEKELPNYPWKDGKIISRMKANYSHNNTILKSVMIVLSGSTVGMAIFELFRHGSLIEGIMVRATLANDDEPKRKPLSAGNHSTSSSGENCTASRNALFNQKEELQHVPLAAATPTPSLSGGKDKNLERHVVLHSIDPNPNSNHVPLSVDGERILKYLDEHLPQYQWSLDYFWNENKVVCDIHIRKGPCHVKSITLVLKEEEQARSVANLFKKGIVFDGVRISASLKTNPMPRVKPEKGEIEQDNIDDFDFEDEYGEDDLDFDDQYGTGYYD